jgi:DNA-binding NarL/FixJ family response regulator
MVYGYAVSTTGLWMIVMRTVVLVSDSSELNKSLTLMMNLSSQCKIIDTASDLDLGLMMVRENRPEMLFIGLSLNRSILSGFIESVRSESPDTKCIVIIDRFGDYNEATKSGADVVIEKSFTVARLNLILDKLYASHPIDT